MPGCGRTLEQMTECYCPCCEKTHSVKIYWSGKGTPRIMCKACKDGSHNFDTRLHCLSRCPKGKSAAM